MATGIIRDNMVLLWENPNPTSAFAAQTVSVDLSEYKFIILCSKLNPNATQTYTELIKVGTVTRIYIFANWTSTIGLRARLATVSETGVTFNVGEGKDITSTSAPSEDANLVIPVQIYGIR